MIAQTIESDLSETIVSFAELRLRPATRAALSRMGIETPTPIQAATLPVLLDGRDVIGQARTGSGKTLAFAIPAIEGVDVRQRHIQVLVLTPTRELAVQVGSVFDDLAGDQGVKTTLIFGGRALGPQRDILRRGGVQVVVGTPGRVLDLLNQGALWLDKVRFLVLDEADEMLDQGFAPDVERILARTNASRQTALFSATVPDWVRRTAANHLDRPVSVAVDPRPEDAAPIPHHAFDVTNGDKLGALQDLLDHRGEGSIIVFGRTKHGVKKLARQLERANYPVAALQGNLSQNARDRVMDDFRSGAVPILLATNVAARGLDITHVELVINMELPESAGLLTHRVGRTGRMGRRGQAITLLAPEDGPKWRRIERDLGRRITRAPWRGARAATTLDGQAAADVAPTPPIATLARPPAPRAVTQSATPVSRPAPVSRPRVNHDRRPAPRTPQGDNPRLDQVATDHRTLLTAHGRDPRRPVWAGETRSATEAPSPAAEERAGDRRSPRRRSRASHQIACAACGQTATVPFQPDSSRPVFCNDCFRDRGGRTQAAAISA